MQACKLRIGEAYPAQVVKAEFDVSSQRAAFLLADSSCLLFTSLTGTSQPQLIPPPCSDICFLRLRERNAALSSSSSEKSTEAATRSDAKKLDNGKKFEKPFGNSVDSARSDANDMVRVSSVGSGMAGLAEDNLVFLVVKSSEVCYSTDVMAWKSCSSRFVQMPICLDGVRNSYPQFRHCPSTVARFQEIRFGSFVGITASINVVVLYSPVHGKVWILSSKYICPDSETERSGRSESVEECVKAMKDTTITSTKGHRKEKSGLLHLIKCAIVDCNGPIYSLYLSLQHLVVGQSDGVRFWNVRPLIKGHKHKKQEIKCNNRCGTFQGSDFVDRVDLEKKKITGCAVSVDKPTKNGYHKINGINDDILNLKLMTKITGLNNGEGIVVIKNRGNATIEEPLEHYINNEFQSNSTMERKVNGFKVLQSAPKVLQHDQTSVHANGVLQPQFTQEDVQGQSKLSQCSLSSTTSSTSSVSVPAISGLQCAPEFAKGDQDGIFVQFKNQKSFSAQLQVASIFSLSEREFLVLDSLGNVHLLSLLYSLRGDEVRMQKASRVSLNATLQPLSCPMKINKLAVLPVQPGGDNVSAGATRTLWVSDGGHTIYILKMSVGGTAKGSSGDTIFRVTQTVFSTDRVCSLVPLSSKAVMVQTEGSMLVYSQSKA